MDLSFVYGQIDVVIRCKIAKLFTMSFIWITTLLSSIWLVLPRMPPPLFVVLLFSLSPVDRKIKIAVHSVHSNENAGYFFSIEDRKSGNLCLYMHRGALHTQAPYRRKY